MYSNACCRGDRYSVWVPLSAPAPALVPRVRERDEEPDESGRGRADEREPVGALEDGRTG